MGPPEFTGGNLRRSRLISNVSATLQWGRRNSPAETPRPRRRACRSRRGFNGAAGIHRRKPDALGELHQVFERASMGPPEFTGGNRVGARAVDAAGAGFNGAAGIHRRKPSRTGRSRSCPPRFNGAAGIHRRKPEKGNRMTALSIEASMGPPEFTGGNTRHSACP